MIPDYSAKVITRCVLWFALLGLFYCGLVGAESGQFGAPEPWDVRNAGLQSELQRVINKLGLAAAVNDGTLAGRHGHNRAIQPGLA